MLFCNSIMWVELVNTLSWLSVKGVSVCIHTAVKEIERIYVYFVFGGSSIYVIAIDCK
jgi:hypothetical protein